jgi:hypothetical protein
MSVMNYRLWITVPGLPWTDEERWAPFIGSLEDRYFELGPILGWEGDTAVVVVSLESDSEAHAAARAVDAVADALYATGLGSRYPSSVEIEAVKPELQAA